jgi:hypothetical protein
MNIKNLRAAMALAVLGAASAVPSVGFTQDLTAMINQEMAAMNANIERGQQMVNGIVQQRMQDPAVRAAYQAHVANAARQGAQPYDFPTFTYYYVYTNGFSSAGVAAAQANEARNQAAEQAAAADLRNAEAERGAAQQGLQDGFSRNQQEAGRMLMGNSTYTAPNGYSQELPHTWQANTYNTYQGNTYYVDASGNYFAYSNGDWVPLHR